MHSLLLSALDAIYDTRLCRKAFWRFIYDWMAGELPEAFRLMNYGYLEDEHADEDLSGEELCQRLYRQVARAIDLSGKILLEVGAGRGGGLVHVKEALAPRAVFGVDLSPRAVALARRLAAGAPGVTFLEGDAEQLPFGDACFDAVLNVESSHCYPSRERFFREVRRVLVPGGHFLYADFFAADAVEPVRAALKVASLQLLTERDITAQVVAALRRDEPRRLALVARLPRWRQHALRNFAATTDSETYALLDRRERRYLAFDLLRG
jgi:SAM-dependent methyltransferase